MTFGKRRTDEPSDDEKLTDLRERLEILEALVGAMEKRAEVLALVEDAEDADDARARVRGLLGVSAGGAQAVLDLQIRRLTRGDRARQQANLEELRRAIAALGG